MSKFRNILFIAIVFVFLAIGVFSPENFKLFSLIVVSIVLEALPFILIGSLISSAIAQFVTEDTLSKILPKNRFLGVIISGGLGLLFPMCECAIVPVARRLVKKGLPTSMAVAFMLATPIINPVVLFSTYTAFVSVEFMLARAILGFISAVGIGLLVDLMYKKDPLIEYDYDQEHHHHDCDCGCHSHRENRFISLIKHANNEFQEIILLLCFGAVISGLLQVFVDSDFLLEFSSIPVISTIALMTLAFILSICSEADAFIASTFRVAFANHSIMAFLIFGPMIDIKNMVMLFASFKKKFVFLLMFLIAIVCFLTATLYGIIGG